MKFWLEQGQSTRLVAVAPIERWDRLALLSVCPYVIGASCWYEANAGINQGYPSATTQELVRNFQVWKQPESSIRELIPIAIPVPAKGVPECQLERLLEEIDCP